MGPGILKLLTLLLISKATYIVKGLVEISPSPVASVCQAGNQLELRCSVPGVFLRWQFNVPGAQVPFSITVSAGGSSGVPPPVMVNSTRFTFSRLSTQPLTSEMTINPVSEGLNGVQVNCVDVETSESATSTIQIIDVGARDTILSIQSHSAQLTRERIIVELEWIVLLSQVGYQELLPNVSITVVPGPGITMIHTGNRTLQLTLLYNTLYNVSLTQPGICGQPNHTAFIELEYTHSMCGNLMALVNNDIRIVGYKDPALEGDQIAFTCPSGHEPNGSKSSTCMGNGEWEPDPREVNCISELQPTTGTLVPSLVDAATTSPTLRTALISVICVLGVMSALMLVIGLICGHCFSQRRRKSSGKKDESPSNPTADPREDLELKDNVAYITIHPK